MLGRYSTTESQSPLPAIGGAIRKIGVRSIGQFLISDFVIIQQLERVKYLGVGRHYVCNLTLYCSEKCTH
jgi:hypothetical protein